MKFVTPFLVLSCLAAAVASQADAQSNAFAAPIPTPTISQTLAQAQPIRVGLIFPLTGGSADMGNSARIGAQVALNEINAVGGFLGRKLELVIRDDAADPSTGLRHAEDLVLKEKVTATLGFCNTGVAMKALDVFQKNKQILIVTCATGTPITAKYPAAESFIFRTSARDGLQTQFLVDEVVRRGLKKVAILADTSGYGDAGLKDLETALGNAGLKAQAVVRFKVGVQTLTEEIKQLRDSGADVLIGWSVGPEEGVISASRQAVGWKVPQLGPWGLSNASAFETSKGAVANTLSVQTVLPNPNMERNSTFLRGYAKLSKEELIGSMMSASQTYDAMHLLLRGIFASKGDLSGPALKAALENLPHIYRGVVTSYEHPFSISDHDAISANMLWLGTWRGGERTYANAEDASRASIIRRKQQ